MKRISINPNSTNSFVHFKNIHTSTYTHEKMMKESSEISSSFEKKSKGLFSCF